MDLHITYMFGTILQYVNKRAKRNSCNSFDAARHFIIVSKIIMREHEVSRIFSYQEAFKYS